MYLAAVSPTVRPAEFLTASSPMDPLIAAGPGRDTLQRIGLNPQPLPPTGTAAQGGGSLFDEFCGTVPRLPIPLPGPRGGIVDDFCGTGPRIPHFPPPPPPPLFSSLPELSSTAMGRFPIDALPTAPAGVERLAGSPSSLGLDF
jgi:hypothetical protein